MSKIDLKDWEVGTSGSCTHIYLNGRPTTADDILEAIDQDRAAFKERVMEKAKKISIALDYEYNFNGTKGTASRNFVEIGNLQKILEGEE